MVRSSDKYDGSIPGNVPRASRTDFPKENVDEESYRIENSVVSHGRRHGGLTGEEHDCRCNNGLEN